MDILNIDPKVIIIQTGGFILLLLVFARFLFRPVRDILDARRNQIEDQYQDAEQKRAQAESLRAEYQGHLERIDEEARTKIAEALKEGQAMREEIISDSRAKGEQILTRAQEEIQRERDLAMAELRTKVADLTVAAAGKLIDEHLDDKKHRDLVSRFIDDIEGVRQ